MDARLKAFPAEARKCFGFLVDEFGFHEAEQAGEGYAGYASPPLWIWVVLEERNNTVDTSVTYSDGSVDMTVLVGDLMFPAKVRGFNPSPGSAVTTKGIAKSLARQAAILREILPKLRDDDGLGLMAQAASR